MTVRVKVAACQYPIEPVGSLDAWASKLDRMVGEAARAGAQLAVLPEYASMELVSALPRTVQADLGAQLEGMQKFLPEYRATCAQLARRYGVYLLAGSFPERVVGSADEYRNRAREILDLFAGRIYPGMRSIDRTNLLDTFSRLLKRERTYDDMGEFSIPIGSRYHPERAPLWNSTLGGDIETTERWLAESRM